MKALTRKHLSAIQAALSSMLAGETGPGTDFADVDTDAAEEALDFINELLAKRRARATLLSAVEQRRPKGGTK